MSDRDTLLLVNTTAGRGHALRVAQAARDELTRRGIPVELRPTADAEDLGACAQAAADAGQPIVAVAGGDGSIQRVARAIAGSGTALGLLPNGRGNDLARALGVPRDAAAAIRLLAEGVPRAIDLGRAGSHSFVTVATFGFDAEVAGIVHRHEVPGHGNVAYGLAILKGLLRYAPVEATLEGDFGRIEGRFSLVATANTDTYGSGIRIAPGASPNDGLLDVCAIGELSNFEILRILPKILGGRHVDHPAVRLLRTRRLEIGCVGPLPVYADGEPTGTAPTSLEAVPGALLVVAPDLA